MLKSEGGEILSVHSDTTVLIIDDEPVSLAFAVAVFKRNGCNTHSAQTKADALQLARVHNPGLVMLDIMIPGSSGTELLQLLTNTLNQRPWYVALTGETRLSEHKKFIRAGFNHVLSKPATTEQLLSCLKPSPQGTVARLPCNDPADDRPLQDTCALTAVGGDSLLLAQLRFRFKTELEKKYLLIDTAIAQGDYGSAAKLVHQLNGAAGYCGALPLQRICRSLEAALRTRRMREIAKSYSAFLQQCECLGYWLTARISQP